MPKKNKTVAKNLIKLQGKMTLRVFAEVIGVGQSTLHNYLKGRDPKASFIKKVCIATGCNPNWLLGILKEEEIGKDMECGIKLAKARQFLQRNLHLSKVLLQDIGGLE